MKWPNSAIQLNGDKHESIAPHIISASRSTDIPAFYAKEFMECLSKGYLFWTNPFNRKKILVSLYNVKFIVFWTKNPAPLVPYLEQLDKLNIGYYFNFTLNNYEKDGFEEKLPLLPERINHFIELSEKIGKEKVIWRFDPIILISGQEPEDLLLRILQIADKLQHYTEKLVISFVDLKYHKVLQKLKKMNLLFKNLDNHEKQEFASNLYKTIKPYNLKLASCACELDLSRYNIFPNKCIDDELIEKISTDTALIELIKQLRKSKKIKDKSQRKHCLCMVSKDVGAYNSCRFSCIYCYAGHHTGNIYESGIFK